MEGFTSSNIHGKLSLRASVTSELSMVDVRVPDSARLPNIKGLKGPLSCLTQARYGIAWGMVGAATDCYNTALDYYKRTETILKTNWRISTHTSEPGGNVNSNYRSTAFIVSIG